MILVSFPYINIGLINNIYYSVDNNTNNPFDILESTSSKNEMFMVETDFGVVPVKYSIKVV